MLLSSKLKEIRLKSNLPQRRVAAELNIDTATYCKYENGTMKMNLTQLEKVVKYLNANREELLTLWQADQLSNAVSTDFNIAANAIEIVYNQYHSQKKQNNEYY